MKVMEEPMAELKQIPKFESEAEERAFWEDENNDSTEYFDWSRAQLVVFPNLKLSNKEDV
jgi:CopG antitoxin of type II toxin-antitoxin system